MLSKSVNRSSFNANLKLKIQFFASETFNCFLSRVTDAWFSTAVDVLSQTLGRLRFTTPRLQNKEYFYRRQ